MAEPSMKATPGPMTVTENKMPAEMRAERGSATHEETMGDTKWLRVHNTFPQCRLFPKQLSDLPPMGIYPIYGDNNPVLSRAPFAGKVLQNSNLSCYFPPAP